MDEDDCHLGGSFRSWGAKDRHPTYEVNDSELSQTDT